MRTGWAALAAVPTLLLPVLPGDGAAQTRVRVVRDLHVPTTSDGVGNAVLPLDDGGFLAVGYDAGLRPDDPAGPTPAAGVVARFGPDGGTRWTRRFEDAAGREDRFLWDAAPAGDGFFLVGYAGPSGAEDVWALRVDGEGRTVWEGRWGGAGRDWAWSTTPDGEGGWYLAAETTPAGVERQAGWLLRVDATGDTAWTRSVRAGEGTTRLFSVARTASGDAVATGGTGSDDRTAGDNDAVVLRAAPDGAVRWVQLFGDDRYDVGHGVVAEGEDALVTGYATPIGNPDGDTDLAVVRVGPGGAPLWRRFFGLPGHERGMMSTPAEGPGADGWVGVGFRVDGQDVDVLLWGLGPGGELRWQGALPSPGLDRGVMVRSRPDGRLLLTGAFGATEETPSTFRVLVVEPLSAPAGR